MRVKNEGKNDKPVMQVKVDGGPDKNPRYMKTMECVIHYFLMYDLDAVFITTNTSGRSNLNRVKGRMAPLSKETAGLILDN